MAVVLFQLNQQFALAELLALIVAAGCLWLAVDYAVIHRHYWLSAAFCLLGVERLLAAVLVQRQLPPVQALALPAAGVVLCALAVVLLRVVVGRLLWLVEGWARGETRK